MANIADVAKADDEDAPEAGGIEEDTYILNPKQTS
jgi:hypothetical protein